MISKASAMYARISPRKARMIANLIRGKDAAEALQLLQFTTKAGAPVLFKVIESAVANARVSNPGQDVDALFISKATVDKGPNKNSRRWRPRAMGRATRVTKGISHIVIELDARSLGRSRNYGTEDPSVWFPPRRHQDVDLEVVRGQAVHPVAA